MSRGTAVAMVAVVALATGVGLFFGVDAPHAVLLAVTAVLTVQLYTLSTSLDPGDEQTGDAGWPERHDLDAFTGVRRDVARVSWGMRGLESRVDRQAVDRLRAVAERRLAIWGLSLDDPESRSRAEAILGPAAHRMLGPDRPPLPTIDPYVSAVGAVERLSATSIEGAQP